MATAIYMATVITPHPNRQELGLVVDVPNITWLVDGADLGRPRA